MVALLARVAEAVWVRGVPGRHVCSPLQRIAMISNPSWFLAVGVWILKIRIALKIMLALSCCDLGVCEFRM